MPTNDPLPKQRYLTRWALKSGVVTDIITEMTEQEIVEALVLSYSSDDFAIIKGVNEKGWPLTCRVQFQDISLWLIVPHEVNLAERPKLGLN